MNPTRIKICGITRIDDAIHAARCGADALGFVFYERSPRHVEPARVREIVEALPPFVTTVGLFVNREVGQVRQIADFCGLDVIQLHGDESPAICRQLAPYRVIKALRLRDEKILDRLDSYPARAILLDAYVPDQFGGTGHRCDWQLAARVAREYPVILAGGLDSDCVAEAVARVRPYGVDVSSGVEQAPGVKDPHKVAAFIHKVKSVRNCGASA